MTQKKKRGIRIKGRVILTGIFLILQIVLTFYAVGVLQVRFSWLYYIFQAIAIFTAIYIVNKRGNPSYKITWIIFILLLPVFGLFIYLLWGGERMFPHLKRRMKRCESHYYRYLTQDRETAELITYEQNTLARQASFLQRESGYPVYTGTDVEYLSPGELFFTRLLEELDKAERYIYLEYFILAEGEMWNAIRKILYKKAHSGVEIKIIFDDFGSIKRQYKDFVSGLRRHGIKVAVFNPIKPTFNVFMNNRNHRKIAIVDGKVAFTGGINIADEYINRLHRFGYWMDSAVMVKGKAVNSFVVMFAVMWEYNTGEQLTMADHLLAEPTENKHYVLPYCDGPMDGHSAAQGIYMQILNTAHRYVYIATPYLILDNNMTNVLTLAAKSGVDVRIVTPYIPDKSYVHPVTQYYYSELLQAGARIFEYTPGFIHSKIFISDDQVATVGTVNMDYRSFVFHFECGTWFTDPATIGEMKAQFDAILSESKEIFYERWHHRSRLMRLKQWFWHLFAPFM